MKCTTKFTLDMDLTFSKSTNQKVMGLWVYSNDKFDIICFTWFIIFFLLEKNKFDKLNRDDGSQGWSKSEIWFKFDNKFPFIFSNISSVMFF